MIAVFTVKRVLMKYTPFSFFIVFFLSVPLSVMPHDDSSVFEQSQDAATIYIRLDQEKSAIADFIFELSNLDVDLDSPVNLLKRHLDDGFVVGLHDEILQVLDYAHSFL